MFFIFVASFMAIFIDSFRQTVQAMGYPSDFQAEAAWEYKDYLQWMIEWVPRPRKKKAIVDDEEEEEELPAQEGEEQEEEKQE